MDKISLFLEHNPIYLKTTKSVEIHRSLDRPKYMYERLIGIAEKFRVGYGKKIGDIDPSFMTYLNGLNKQLESGDLTDSQFMSTAIEFEKSWILGLETAKDWYGRTANDPYLAPVVLDRDEHIREHARMVVERLKVVDLSGVAPELRTGVYPEFDQIKFLARKMREEGISQAIFLMRVDVWRCAWQWVTG